MSFVATWMDLEIVRVSELSQSYPTIWLTCGIWKKNTSELICIRETDSQSLKTNLQSPKGTGGMRNAVRVWDWHIHTVVYGMTGQWGTSAEHRELYPIFCDNPYLKRIWKKIDVHICIKESLCCQQKLPQHCKLHLDKT